MRILFTSNLSGLGGGETSILQIINKLKERHEIVLLCCEEGDFPKAARKAGIEVVIDNFKRKNIIYTFMIYIKLGKFDLLHHNECSAALLFGFFNCFTIMRRKNYWTCHGQWYVFNTIKVQLINLLISNVFCVSKNVYYNLQSQKVNHLCLSYLGVDFSKNSIRNGICFRKEFGFKESDILITTIARYESVKGQLKAIEALESIMNRNDQLHYLLIGGCPFGSKEDEAYYQKIVERIKKSTCRNNIHIIGERRDVECIMQEVDLLLVPSDRESLSMVTIEALKNNLLVISTPCEGPEEILEGDSFFICEENSSKGIAKQITRFLYEEDFKRQMMNRFPKIKENAIKKFDLGNVVKRYEDVFGC